MRDNLALRSNNQAVTNAAECIIQHRLAKGCYIIRTTDNSNDFIAAINRNTKYHAGLLVYTALQRIAECLFPVHTFDKIASVGNILNNAIVIVRSSIRFNQCGSIQIRILSEGKQWFSDSLR